VKAHAKINLALVVGPIRDDAKHEVTTVLQRIELADRIELESSPELRITGFEEDTLVRRALLLLADAASVEPTWAVRIDKEIPIAAGLGGGSSDAAAAHRLANETLETPLQQEELHTLAATVGADVPFFLTDGPQLGEGDGSDLTALELPHDYTVLVALAAGAAKESTASVYAGFDERRGGHGYAARRAELLRAVAAGDIAAFPPNDLARSPLAARLRTLGAFRADVSGAGPAVYALFADPDRAAGARAQIEAGAQVWVGLPAW
jgi:4-diphosphocytidyl-2-C-methyl-D-erythritol kinase